MDIFSMQCFISIAENKNLTRAAEYMGITQPAISVQLKKIEGELGVTLLERTSHKVTLTKAGAIAFEGFKKTVSDYNDTVRNVQSLGKGKFVIRVGYEGPVNWANIQTFFTAYLRNHPESEIKIIQSDWGALVQRLEKGELDFAFIEVSELAHKKKIKHQPLFSESACLAVDAGHPLSGKGKVSPEDIAGQTIFYNRAASEAMEQIYRMFLNSGVKEENVKSVEGAETSIAMAQARHGMAVLPASFKNESTGRNIVYIDYDSDDVRLDYVVAWNGGNDCKVRKEFLRECADFPWSG